MKLIFLAFLIPLALLGSDSLDQNWQEVADGKNGLNLLKDIHELTRLVDDAEFHEFIEEYEGNRQWDDRTFVDLIERSTQVEKTVAEALRLNVWQVEGFYTPDTKAEELDVFKIWEGVQIVRFQKYLISSKPMEAYQRAHDLSQSGLKMMSAKGGANHFLSGFFAYTKGLKLLDTLESNYPSTEYEDFSVSKETLKEYYRDVIRHEYGSTIKTVDYLVTRLKDQGKYSEYVLDVHATKEIITEFFQEAFDNSFREPSDYTFESRKRIEIMIEERSSLEKLKTEESFKNAAGLKLLTIFNWNPENIWELVQSRSTQHTNARKNQPQWAMSLSRHRSCSTIGIK